MTVPVFPDAESALMYALVPAFPAIRFVTSMPGGELPQTTVRLHRISGSNRNIGVDDPVIDVDVFGLKAEMGNVSVAAREIQAFILSLMSAQVQNGVIVHATTVNAPRSLPEANQDLCRYSATYELHIHP